MIEQAARATESNVVIDVWSDLGCPWCYIGTHRLRTAIARRPDADRFAIRMRSFELNPNASREPETVERVFIRTYGGNADQFLRAEREAQALANGEGMPYSLDRLNANSFDIHRVLQYANDNGLGLRFFSTVQDGFFAGELNPYESQTLIHVGESIGLNGRRVHEILASDEYADRVHADRNEGLELGVTGVPFVVLDARLAAPGAQTTDLYERLLEQVTAPSTSQGERHD